MPCGDYEYRIQIAALWVHAILYGLNVALFTGSIYVLLWRRPNTRHLVVTILLFLVATALCITQLVAMLLTPYLSTHGVAGPGATYVLCGPPPEPTERNQASAQSLITFVQDWVYLVGNTVADGLLISRCFALWGPKRWVSLLPSFLLLGTIACNLTIIGFAIAAGPAAPSKPLDLIAQIKLADDILGWLSLSTSVVTTFLIALKIWLMTRAVEVVAGRGAAKRYQPIIMIVVESGAIISASQLAAVLTRYPTGNIVAGAIVRQLIVTAPTLIIVRIGLRKGFESVQETLTHRDAAHDISRPARRLGVADREAGVVSTIHFSAVLQDAESVSLAESASSQEVSRAEKERVRPVKIRPIVEGNVSKSGPTLC